MVNHPPPFFLSLFLVDADDGDVEHAGAHQQGLAVLPPREPQSSQHGQHHGQVLLDNLLLLLTTLSALPQPTMIHFDRNSFISAFGSTARQDFHEKVSSSFSVNSKQQLKRHKLTCFGGSK